MKRKLLTLIRALRKNHKHILCVALTISFVIISVAFFQTSYARILEAFRDFGLSIAHVFASEIQPTVNELSTVDLVDLGIIPQDIDLFLTKLSLYGKMLINAESFSIYGSAVGNVALIVSYVIICALLPLLVVILLISIMLKLQNNNYNSDTRPLKIVKRISEATYLPIKKWLTAFRAFLNEHSYYLKIWLFIWLFNFNAGTIIVEAFAYYFYFCVSIDFLHLYVQVYKLLLDLSVVILFIPVWLWIVIAIVIYCKWREKKAFDMLDDLEARDEEHVRGLPIASLICGPMGTKKTTFLSDIAITANKVFRDVALEKLIANDMKFPYFPWVNLENCIKYGINRHTIYNLATCKKFINIMRVCYERADIYAHCPSIRKALNTCYGYDFDNYIFGYDVDRYGFIYDDKLELKTVFDVLESYTQHYFIYIVSGTLLYSNYSIRADGILTDVGNFPLWDMDFFRRDTEAAFANSHRSHILDFDMLRLGEKVLQNNKLKDVLEFGIIAITEVGKERGNQYTVATHKSITKVLQISANQDTDLFNVDVKMCRSRATVDNYPYVFFLMDEQRASSLGADFKELCDVVYISKSTDFKINSPLYAIDEIIYIFANTFFNKYYCNDRFNKGNNTLLRHTLKTFYNVIYQHYIKVYNQFSVSTLTFSIQDGASQDVAKKGKYKLSKKKIHSAVFATDVWNAYYVEKALRSRYGINDVPEYAGRCATISEIEQQHSYFDMDCRLTIYKEYTQ